MHVGSAADPEWLIAFFSGFGSRMLPGIQKDPRQFVNLSGMESLETPLTAPHERLKHYTNDTARLRWAGLSAETRLRLIESRLTLAFTFCSLAETQMVYDQQERAATLLERARQTSDQIFDLLKEIPDRAAGLSRALETRLTRLQGRLIAIQTKLG